MQWRMTLLMAATSIYFVGTIQAAEYTVSQNGKVFSSTAMTLQPGDRITFVNDDSVVHNVFSRSAGAKFDAIQKPGESSTVSFQSEGVAEVRCVFHPTMKLTVKVQN